MISIIKRRWKLLLLLLVIILPLGFVLGPIIYKFYSSYKTKKLKKLDHQEN